LGLIGRWFWRLIAWSTDAVNQAKLDQEEQKQGIYFCPYCNREVDHIHDAD
jgi:uncharacterized protein (UPF0212 family)